MADLYSYCSNLIDSHLPHERKHKIATIDVLKYSFLILQTGSPWSILDKMHLHCSSSTIYKTFNKWCKLGIIEKIWIDVVKTYIQKRLCEDKYAFKNLIIDSTMIRNIQGIDVIGRNYQDKHKYGTKISAICDMNKIPLSFLFYPSNVHDIATINESLDAIPLSTTVNNRFKGNLLGDKGYRSKEKKVELQMCGINLVANHRNNEKIKNSKKELKANVPS